LHRSEILRPALPLRPAARRGTKHTETEQSERRRVAEEIQRQAFQDVPYIPLGQYVNASAYRRNLAGVMTGCPVFWNLRLE
jgi:peptide/nickel transport system substrate-binding protein